jgi:hypothetical protein
MSDPGRVCDAAPSGLAGSRRFPPASDEPTREATFSSLAVAEGAQTLGHTLGDRPGRRTGLR